MGCCLVELVLLGLLFWHISLIASNKTTIEYHEVPFPFASYGHSHSRVKSGSPCEIDCLQIGYLLETPLRSRLRHEFRHAFWACTVEMAITVCPSRRRWTSSSYRYRNPSRVNFTRVTICVLLDASPFPSSCRAHSNPVSSFLFDRRRPKG